MSVRILQGDALQMLKTLPSESVHCCVTSPPYLGLRDYNVTGQIGLERTPEEWCDKLVAVFAEVRRVLRHDGTLWVNIGDCYASDGGFRDYGSSDGGTGRSFNSGRRATQDGLAAGNLLPLSDLLARALQQDGWLYRDRVVWAKGISFCGNYVGSVMPESTNGWRWVRCRRKVGPAKSPHPTNTPSGLLSRVPPKMHTGHSVFESRVPQWRSCPGCPKCEPHGGYILKRGSWRPTQAHEAVLILAKRMQYYADRYAVEEEGVYPAGTRAAKGSTQRLLADGVNARPDEYATYNGKRNLRSVWAINPEPFSAAKYGITGVDHFATFPTKLVEVCLRASTSDRGVCPKCGMPWARVVETEYRNNTTATGRPALGNNEKGGSWYDVRTRHIAQTLGWRSCCNCQAGDPIPATVLDPFSGSGRTGLVADRLGRDAVLIELNPNYCEMARQMILQEGGMFAEVSQF